jgi:hypothetical protein
MLSYNFATLRINWDGVPKTRVVVYQGGVHHRILYFFHGAVAAVVSHGVLKQRVVPLYEGHSLAMLRRIAGVLNQRVEIRFVPIRRPA